MRDIEKVIEQVNGSMAIEGMPLTDEDRERIRRCAGNHELVEREVQTLVKKYFVPAVNMHEQRLQL